MTTRTLTNAPAVDTRPLRMTDRCDRCGAQAYVRATMFPKSDSTTAFDLLLCGHHFRNNETKLRAVAMHIDDQTAKLDAVSKPDASP